MSFSLTVLSLARILIGGSSLVSPTFTASFVSYPYYSGISSMSYRLFGSRELVLGSCLWLANDRSSELLRPLLLIGAVIDAIDIISTGACILQEGNLSPWAIAISAGGAALFTGIQLWAWKGLSGKSRLKEL